MNEDETAYRKAWEINVLRRMNEAIALEYVQPLYVLQAPWYVRRETFTVRYFAYPDTRLGELLFNHITAAALLWGVTTCILSML